MASKLIKVNNMPRVTKSVTAKTKHKKVLSATKGHYGARSRLYKTAKQSNIKSLQYALEIEKIKKERLGLYGYQELMQVQEILEFHIHLLLMDLIKNILLLIEKFYQI